MEANDLSGRILPGMASGSGHLGLEMPLHQHQHQHQQQLHFPHHQQPHQQLVSYPTHEAKSQQSVKQNNHPYPNKAKHQHLSDEDENGYNIEDGGDDGKKKMSPWHRMKWTDNMVRLLIMAVFYIGDDCSIDANDASCTIKKKGGGVVLQKKGKWKSVSKAMMEKGFYVSPQQCEDKFNDLNKRYKRVNDILGKGTACSVVENQSLLETMDHLTAKLKEEVRKLLNSKHLFFREMCAYHNSGGKGGNVGGNQLLEAAAESSHHQQQHCFHSPENGTVGANPRNRLETEGSKTANGGREVVDVDDEDEDEDDDNDDNEDEEDDNDDEEETEGGSGGGRHEINGDENDLVSRKRKRREMFSSPLMKQMSCELVGVLQDGAKSPSERRQWMLSRMFQLEEQKVSYQYEAFELEKQRVKWIKFSAKKEREMERMKLNNERMRLENDRMVLLLRKKELELLQHHQQRQSSNNRPDPSSLAG